MIDDQRTENMTASFVTTITTAGMVFIGTIVSAFACENFAATASHGNGNTAVSETWGSHYLSFDQDGDQNSMQGGVKGHCNKVVAGQYGDGNRFKTNVAGAYNKVGSLQYADDVKARIGVRGVDNIVGNKQYRDNSQTLVDVAGTGNIVLSIQH
jgi:hypothetical protein